MHPEKYKIFSFKRISVVMTSYFSNKLCVFLIVYSLYGCYIDIPGIGKVGSHILNFYLKIMLLRNRLKGTLLNPFAEGARMQNI